MALAPWGTTPLYTWVLSRWPSRLFCCRVFIAPLTKLLRWRAGDAVGTHDEELPAEQSSCQSPERRVPLSNNATLSEIVAERFMDCSKKKKKKRLQLGLHIHFPSEKVILQGEGLQAKQLSGQSHGSWWVPHFLMSRMLPDQSQNTHQSPASWSVQR